MLIYITIFVVFFLEPLASLIPSLTRAINLMPELLSGMAAILLFGGIIKKFKFEISQAYVFIFIFIFSLFFVSAVANSVQPGAVFAGLRTYLKYIPFFILPILISVSDVKLLNQLKIILLCTLLQLPVSLYQRFISHPDVRTGDFVTGTFSAPSVLTIMTLSAIAIILSAYYKKLVNFKFVIIMFAMLLIPPTINETTITLFYLPLVFALPTFLYYKYSSDKKRLTTMIIIGSFSLVVFATGYNVFYGDRWGGDITNIFSKDEKLSGFLMKKEASASSDARIEGEIGRFDSMSLAFGYLSKYPTKIAMGVGIGNAADAFTEKLRGSYNIQYLKMGGDITAVSHLLWETGILGIFIILVLFLKIYLDSYSLIGKEGIYGVLALAWTVVILMIVISMVYKNLIPVNALGYLFWYFSGCLVAESYRNRMKVSY